MDERELSPEQKREVFYRGGLSETVTLAGRKLTLGELAHRDRYKIFECFERDIEASYKAYKDYVQKGSPGFLRLLLAAFRKLLGIEEKRTTAVSVVRKFVEEMTVNDVVLIQVCAEGRNGGMTPAEIKELVMSSPPSEVQVAVQKALEVNGIDVKKYQAARKATVPSAAA